MPDNRDYWKEILGDDFDEDLYRELTGDESKPEETAAPETIAEETAVPVFEEKTVPELPTDEEIFAPVSMEISSFDEPAGDGFDEPIQWQDPNSLFDDIPGGFSLPSSSDNKTSSADAENVTKDAKPEKSDKKAKTEKKREEKAAEEEEAAVYEPDPEYGDYEYKFPIHRSREKRWGCVGGLMFFIFVVCISAVLACVAWMAATDVLALGKTNQSVEVTIPKGYTIDKVSDILYDNDLIEYKWLFKIFADFSDADQKIAAGTYILNRAYDYRAIVNGMTTSGGTKPEVEVTIPEGYTMKQIFKLLEQKGVSSYEDLMLAAETYEFDYDFISDEADAQRLEGFLFPDTYIFYISDTPNRVIRKMLNNFENRFTAEYLERIDELGYTMKEIITIASMIEREAAVDDERKNISSVIYNRLNSEYFPHLQIDAAVIYGLGDAYEGVITSEHLQQYTPYNTYVIEGLPIGPIANPGMASIRAAMYPADTSYYYYALSIEGVHRFFTNGDDFDNFVNGPEYGG